MKLKRIDMRKLTRGVRSPRRGDTMTALKRLNQFLTVAVLIVAVMSLWGLWARSAPFELAPPPAPPADAVQIDAATADGELLRYVNTISRKELFKKGVPEPDDPVEDRVQRKTLQDLTLPLRLIGIFAGEEPVVLIRDNLNEKTYTLRVNEYLDALMIKEIRLNSVILMYEDETLELRL